MQLSFHLFALYVLLNCSFNRFESHSDKIGLEIVPDLSSSPSLSRKRLRFLNYANGSIVLFWLNYEVCLKQLFSLFPTHDSVDKTIQISLNSFRWRKRAKKVALLLANKQHLMIFFISLFDRSRVVLYRTLTSAPSSSSI